MQRLLKRVTEDGNPRTSELLSSTLITFEQLLHKLALKPEFRRG
jgi:hypothetical protein